VIINRAVITRADIQDDRVCFNSYFDINDWSTPKRVRLQPGCQAVP
jgi:hypothetical protein